MGDILKSIEITSYYETREFYDEFSMKDKYINIQGKFITMYSNVWIIL